jgi:predicted PurR-regulated permease PerM
LAYLVSPVVHYFEARALRRGLVVCALYSIIALGVAGLAGLLLPHLSDELSLLQSKFPDYAASLQQAILKAQSALSRKFPMGPRVVEGFNLKMYDPLMEKLPLLPSYLLGLFPLLSLIFLVPFITFFLLLDSEASLRSAIQACPSRYVEQALHLIDEVDAALGDFLRGIMITAAVIGLASFAGLWALGVDYALAVGALCGVSSFIPYLGVVLGVLVGGLVAFIQFHSWAMPLKVAVFFFGVRVADEALVQPLISRHAMHLHPLAFLFALMLGGKLFGFIGLLFAVPAACVLKALAGVGYEYYVTQTQARHPVDEGSEIPYV